MKILKSILFASVVSAQSIFGTEGLDIIPNQTRPNEQLVGNGLKTIIDKGLMRYIVSYLDHEEINFFLAQLRIPVGAKLHRDIEGNYASRVASILQNTRDFYREKFNNLLNQENRVARPYRSLTISGMEQISQFIESITDATLVEKYMKILNPKGFSSSKLNMMAYLKPQTHKGFSLLLRFSQNSILKPYGSSKDIFVKVLKVFEKSEDNFSDIGWEHLYNIIDFFIKEKENLNDYLELFEAVISSVESKNPSKDPWKSPVLAHLFASLSKIPHEHLEKIRNSLFELASTDQTHLTFRANMATSLNKVYSNLEIYQYFAHQLINDQWDDWERSKIIEALSNISPWDLQDVTQAALLFFKDDHKSLSVQQLFELLVVLNKIKNNPSQSDHFQEYIKVCQNLKSLTKVDPKCEKHDPLRLDILKSIQQVSYSDLQKIFNVARFFIRSYSDLLSHGTLISVLKKCNIEDLDEYINVVEFFPRDKSLLEDQRGNESILNVLMDIDLDILDVVVENTLSQITLESTFDKVKDIIKKENKVLKQK